MSALERELMQAVRCAGHIKSRAPLPRPRHGTGGTSSHASQTLLAALVRDLRHMDAVAAADLIEWLEWLTVAGKRPKTIYAYGRGVAPLLRAYPELPFEQFTAAHINSVLADVPLRSRYISRAIYASWFERWGLRVGRILVSPMNGVPDMREPKRAEPDFYTDEEVAVLEALDLPDGPLFTILFGTGARREDARKLQRRSIDLDRGRVTFEDGKGGKTAWVPIRPHVAAAVADLDLFERLGPSDHLWYRKRYPVGHPSRRGPRPIGDTTFEEWYRDAITAAGVRYLSPHKTRHTFGHWLKRQGHEVNGVWVPMFDTEDRQRLMRHDDPRTTTKYYPATSMDDLAKRYAKL